MARTIFEMVTEVTIDPGHGLQWHWCRFPSHAFSACALFLKRPCRKNFKIWWRNAALIDGCPENRGEWKLEVWDWSLVSLIERWPLDRGVHKARFHTVLMSSFSIGISFETDQWLTKPLPWMVVTSPGAVTDRCACRFHDLVQTSSFKADFL
jgi:hypothetical protein